VGVEGCISRCTCQVLAITEWDVFPVGVFVAFGQAEVDNIDIVFGTLSGTNQEVVRLDVAMDNALFVCLLNSLDLIKISMKLVLLTI